MKSFDDKSPLVSEVAIVVLFIMLLLAPILDNLFGGLFSYVDEIACVFLIVWMLLMRDSKHGTEINEDNKYDRRIVACLILICAFGFVGNLIFNYQANVLAIIVDFFTCVKFFLSYLAAKEILKKNPACLKTFQYIGIVFVLSASLGLILHISGVAPMGSGRVMFGIPCYQFLFSHPTNLAAYCVGFAAIMFAGKKPRNVWILLICILLLATQRAKAIAMAFVIMVLLLYGLVKQDDQRPPKFLFIFLIAGSAILAMDQIQEYFFTSTSARSLLMQDGVDIAIRSFPFGSGFATFATYMSGVFYSPLYYEYGLNSVWGLWPSNPSFVSDSFWPAVLAQFGAFGLIAMVALLITTFQSICCNAKKSAIRFAAYGIIPIYLIILSTADASFFNFYGPFYALTISAIMNSSSY